MSVAETKTAVCRRRSRIHFNSARLSIFTACGRRWKGDVIKSGKGDWETKQTRADRTTCSECKTRNDERTAHHRVVRNVLLCKWDGPYARRPEWVARSRRSGRTSCGITFSAADRNRSVFVRSVGWGGRASLLIETASITTPGSPAR